MNKFESEHDVYSSRWGHTDKYYITFTDVEMEIKRGSFSALCKRNSRDEMEWSGYNSQTGNPLMKIFSNDSIHAPQIIPFAMETVYQQWLDGEIDDGTASGALNELFEWIDICSRNKPSGNYWSSIF